MTRYYWTGNFAPILLMMRFGIQSDVQFEEHDESLRYYLTPEGAKEFERLDHRFLAALKILDLLPQKEHIH